MIENLGHAYPPLAANGFEFGQGAAEGGGIGAARQKEIELVGARGDSFAAQGDLLDGGMGSALGEGKGGEPEQNSQVEAGSGEPDAASVLSAAFQTHPQIQGTAGQTAQGKPFAKPGDQPAQDEAQGFEVIDGIFEIDGLLDSSRGGLGEGGVGILTPGPGE